jgi:hypothetical protein
MLIALATISAAFWIATILDAKSSVGWEANEFWGRNKFWVHPNGLLRKNSYFLTNAVAFAIPIIVAVIFRTSAWAAHGAFAFLLITTGVHFWAWRHNVNIGAWNPTATYKNCFIVVTEQLYGYKAKTIVNYKTLELTDASHQGVLEKTYRAIDAESSSSSQGTH